MPYKFLYLKINQDFNVYVHNFLYFYITKNIFIILIYYANFKNIKLCSCYWATVIWFMRPRQEFHQKLKLSAQFYLKKTHIQCKQ